MIKYILDGIECNPSNKDLVEYTADFTDKRPRVLELSVDSLRFVREDFTRIMDWLSTYGRFVGMPLDIEYSNGLVVKYMLDFQDESFSQTSRSVDVKLKVYKGTDNFFDNANGLSFSSISWDESDFNQVDYVVIPEQQFIYLVTIGLATFTVTREVINASKEVVETTTDLIKATVPVGVPVPGPDWGAIIILGIKLAFRIAYLLLVVVALIKLIVELVNLVFQPIRQFKSCTVKKLIEKGCSHLGYTLSSTLLDSISQLTILPVPLKEKNPSLWKSIFQPASLAYTNGYPSPRDSVFLLGQLIEQVELIFRAKTVVQNSVVKIETVSYFEQNAAGLIPKSFNLQSEINEQTEFNTNEIFKRLVAKYDVDPIDMNTFDDTAKSLYEVSSEVISSPDENLNLIKGVDMIEINFARGTRKGELTFVEKAVKVLATAADFFTGGNAVATIEARKDVMQVSSQYFSKTKLLWMNGTKLNSNQNDFIGADVIVNTYHSGRFIQNNQKNVSNQMPLALTEAELFNLVNNNFVNLNDGKIIEILNINWSEKRVLALIDYTVRKNSTNEQTTVINAG